MKDVEPIAPFLGPLEKNVAVPRSPAEAFRIFTEEIARWWPLTKFSVRVTLVHSGWQKLGEKGAAAREGYGPGWGFVLGEAYAAACA